MERNNSEHKETQNSRNIVSIRYLAVGKFPMTEYYTGQLNKLHLISNHTNLTTYMQELEYDHKYRKTAMTMTEYTKIPLQILKYTV